MKDKTKSKTEREVEFGEALVGIGHYKTTISNSSEKAEGRGSTPEKSQEIASSRWESGKTTSKGGCYLTTACIESKGLPDNCLELKTLRNFRDKILMKDTSGRRAVREYYDIAPEIVQAIGEQKNSEEIWQSIYGDIKSAVSLVMSRDFEGAFKKYFQMTSRLKEEYLN
jgi:hypothetical protein